MSSNFLYIEQHEFGEPSNMYELKVKPTGYRLGNITMAFSSHDAGWTDQVRGKKAVKLKDDGNGVSIKFRSGTKVRLDYSEIEEMDILLDYYKNHSGLGNPTNIVKFETEMVKLVK